jgi:hypothetical protein
MSPWGWWLILYYPIIFGALFLGARLDKRCPGSRLCHIGIAGGAPDLLGWLDHSSQLRRLDSKILRNHRHLLVWYDRVLRGLYAVLRCWRRAP